jgi:hypothetical protein
MTFMKPPCLASFRTNFVAVLSRWSLYVCTFSGMTFAIDVCYSSTSYVTKRLKPLACHVARVSARAMVLAQYPITHLEWHFERHRSK